MSMNLVAGRNGQLSLIDPNGTLAKIVCPPALPSYVDVSTEASYGERRWRISESNR